MKIERKRAARIVAERISTLSEANLHDMKGSDIRLTERFMNFLTSDLAEERHESDFGNGKVRFSQYEKAGIRVSDLTVLPDGGEEMIGRVTGRYITVSFPDVLYLGEANKEILSDEITRALSELTTACAKRILIVGLGNRNFTSDSIGVWVAEGVEATPPQMAELSQRAVATLIPGTEGQTGLATVWQVKHTAEIFAADLVIVIDALAAKDTARLLRTVELCDTGIAPGSGIGGSQTAICRETVGIPTLGIGIPTVTRSAAFAEKVSLFVGADEEAAHSAAHAHAGYFVVPGRLDYGVRTVAALVCRAIGNFIHPQ